MKQRPASDADFVGIVVAAGGSARFGDGVPKQFRQLGGRTVLERSITALAAVPAVRGVVVVLAAGDAGGPRGASVRQLPAVLDVVAGGARRSDSVRLGLAALGDARYVLVHDAARPLASPRMVGAVVEATRSHGAAVPCLAVHDTVKAIDADGFVESTPDRSRLRLAQTPQGALVEWLGAALDEASRDGSEVTDEAAALERVGRRVAVVAGETDNFKITRPADLERASRLLGESAMDLRVGTGFDIHRFDPGRRLVLGGVAFEGEPGLAGHSDADVALHAAMDAVLGAAGLGDIGEHFPPGDPRYAGASSVDLAETVARLIGDEGYEVVNLDLTLLAERPRIGPRVPRMRETIGRCFGIERSRVGVKATTLERIGALGRGEGIAAQAVALLARRRGA